MNLTLLLSFYLVTLVSAQDDICFDPCHECLTFIDNLKHLVDDPQFYKLASAFCNTLNPPKDSLCNLLLDQSIDFIHKVDANRFCHDIKLC